MNIHGTMGWKLSFQFVNQNFCNPYQNTQKSWTFYLHEHDKKMRKNDNEKQKITKYMAYFCTSFSLGIQTQQIHHLSPLKSTRSQNPNELPKHDDHLAQMSNVEL